MQSPFDRLHFLLTVLELSLVRGTRLSESGDATNIASEQQMHKRRVDFIAFSPDGTRIASVSWDHIRIWNISAGVDALSTLRAHEGPVYSVAFSPDGTRIVSGPEDQTVRVWDVNLGTEILPTLRGHEGPIRSVAFSFGGARIVPGSHDCTVRAWDMDSGAEVFPALRGHGDMVRCVAFSLDGLGLSLVRSTEMSEFGMRCLVFNFQTSYLACLMTPHNTRSMFFTIGGSWTYPPTEQSPNSLLWLNSGAQRHTKERSLWEL
jgi:WD40 repeat protein